MRKMIFGSMAVALHVWLVAGCTSPSAEQPTPNASSEPIVSASPQIGTVSPPSSLAPSESPSSAPAPVPSPEPSSNDADSKVGKQQGAADSTEQGEDKQAAGTEHKGSEPPKGDQSGKPDSDPEKVTVGQIKEKYAAQLTEIGSFYKSEIQNIYNEAAAAQSKEQSKRELYDSYLQKASALEEESQAKVNQFLSQMKGALTENKLPTDSINELRAAYYAEVAKAKESFAAKAKSEFGLK